MSSTAPGKIEVALADGTAFIKIAGRANFSSGVQFKSLLQALSVEGGRRFMIDLTDCLIMDSTFLGILAGFGMKSSEINGALPVELLNPNPRISSLLENLGVTHLFKLRHGASFCEAPYNSAEASDSSKEETTRICLEAHETLMAANPANVPKFKDVALFLEENLQRQK